MSSTIVGVLFRYDASPEALRGLIHSPGIAASEHTYDGEKLFEALEASFKRFPPKPEDDAFCLGREEEPDCVPVMLPDGKHASLYLYWQEFFPEDRPANYDELYPEAFILDYTFPREVYSTLRGAIDGTEIEEIDAVLEKLHVSKVNEPLGEEEMERSPRTEIERLTKGGGSFGNTSSGEVFTAENDVLQFLVCIHYGQCYTSRLYFDKTTETLKAV